MRFSLALVACLFCTPAWSQDGTIAVSGFGVEEASNAVQITILGPSTADSGDEVILRLSGTPALDLAEPLVDQLGWLMGDGRLFVYLAMPGAALVPLDVRGELVFGPSGATMQPMVRVPCGDPGEYRLLVDWNFGQDQLVEHILTVGGPSPRPFPKPEPKPEPVPPGKRFVLVIEETGDRTADQAATIGSLRRHLEEIGAWYRIVDRDLESDWLPSYLEKIKQDKLRLPALMVVVPPTQSQPDGAYLVADTLPARAEEAISLVDEALKQ